MMSNQTTLAGHKIEAWRRQQNPRVTRAMLADQLGMTGSAIQKWEREGTRPDDESVVQLLNDRSIALYSDWWHRAPLFDRARPYLCTLCEKRNDDPVVRQCSRAGCSNVGTEQVEEEMAA